ncbi:sugar phosphate isomerase/epimerase [Bacillaceae bacterium S4-13-56]
MAIGVLAHLFGKLPYDQLAKRVAENGFEYVQLAIWKAIDGYDFSNPGKLNPGLVRNIRKEFDKHGVSVSVLACYLHMFDRDREKRKLNMERFKELIRYAPQFGSTIVAAEVGKRPNSSFTDQDWRVLKENLIDLLKEAEKWGVTLAIEPATGHMIGDAPTLYKMIQEIPLSNFAVVIDAGNLVTKDNFQRQDEIINEAFELLGDRVVACHAKDRLIIDGKIETVAPGQGDLNYSLYLELAEKYKPSVDIIMEKATSDEMLECKNFLENKRQEAVQKISFNEKA